MKLERMHPFARPRDRTHDAAKDKLALSLILLMVEGASSRIQRLQERINQALLESQGERRRGRFSQYIDTSWTQLEEKLFRAASCGGIEGIEKALNEFDLMRPMQDAQRLRYALLSFLANNKEVSKLGLFIPSLEERSPQKVIPSSHEAIDNKLADEPKERHGDT
jgi:hypothetical protein